MKLQESAGVSFSLSFLVQILTAIAVGVWAYSQLDARISSLQNQSDSYDESITRIEENIISSQDAPISSDHVQNTSLIFIERQLEQHRHKIEILESRLYEMSAVP